MAQVASVNYDTKRVFLHADTVAGGFDAVAAYFEINALRAANAFGEQKRAPFLSAEGNIPKTATTFTPRYVLMNAGWRFVPHDTGPSTSYNLDLMVEIISKEQLTDRDVFDRAGLACTVNIDPIYTPVEIRSVSTGSAVTAQDKNDIAAAVWQHATGAALAVRMAETWGRLGLDPSKPVTQGNTQISFGDVVLALSIVGGGSGTITRQ